MMEKNPEKRISSAREVAARLEPWAGESTTGISTARIGRSPWMAPPPPLDPDTDAPVELPEEHPQQESSHSGTGAVSFGSHAIAIESNRTGVARDGALPTPMSVSNLSASLLKRMTPGMIVALTLAIAIPPALVIGAILGYLLRGSNGPM
jgi:eukaryotic-like serine/threonine-protein kinase